jgi:hypothetical protein
VSAEKAAAETIARDRALARLSSLASGERVMATEVLGTAAQALADSHARTAELLDVLITAAPRVWANAEKLAALRAADPYLEGS